MGAWSPAAVHRPALAWCADARRASVRPLPTSRTAGPPGPAARREDSRVDPDELLRSVPPFGRPSATVPVAAPAQQAPPSPTGMPPQPRRDPGLKAGVADVRKEAGGVVSNDRSTCC